MNPGCHRAFVGLGSNLPGPLGHPVDYVDTAIDRLAANSDLYLLGRSAFYRSQPWGNEDQPDFVNAVVEIHSHLEPHPLLKALLAIEADLGRERSGKWEPRHIDLDLLCFDDVQLQSESLELPHPHMHERAFVLQPLFELDPEFQIPGKGSVKALLDIVRDEKAVSKL